ncbi:MAG TPA: PilZ domain-containing protein [Nitrospira sp.]|nr:PilZ domain-containing protein [Nitrospira sp.]
MAFIVRPYRRFPVVIPAIYENWSQEGQGMIWNLSSAGWRLSGDLPLAPGDICSLTVMLPTNKSISVAAGVVRWVRGEEFGIETLAMNKTAHARLSTYIQERSKAL